MCEVEFWKDIPGFDGKYTISSDGRIINHKFERELIANRSTTRPWIQVCLSKNGRGVNYRLGYLVADLFLDPPEDPSMKSIIHRDGDRANNCVRNLAWHTRSFSVLYYKACTHPEVRELRRFQSEITGRIYNTIMDFAGEHLFNPMDVWFGLQQENRFFGEHGRLIYLSRI